MDASAPRGFNPPSGLNPRLNIVTKLFGARSLTLCYSFVILFHGSEIRCWMKCLVCFGLEMRTVKSLLQNLKIVYTIIETIKTR